MVRRLPNSNKVRLLAGLWAIALCAACSLFEGGSDDEPPPEEVGYLVTSGQVTLDDFSFATSACREILPENQENEVKPDPPSPFLEITATACWNASVRVLDSNGAPVDSFVQAFAIWDRNDGDKDRGEVGYLVWKKKPDRPEWPPGFYTWHIRFDFGEGRVIPLRALQEIAPP